MCLHCRTLDFYSYGALLRKREGDAVTEYAIDPAQVAVALAAKVILNTYIPKQLFNCCCQIHLKRLLKYGLWEDE